MRSKQITVYKFDELSDDAKGRAKEAYARDEGYAWAAEALDSLKALAKHFGGRLTDYSIDYFSCGQSSAEFDMPELSARETKLLLGKLGTYNKRTGRGDGECKLTGYCADENAIDGFRLAWRAGERDLNELMQAAFDSWLKAAQADCDWQYSDEAFAEHCEANGYEFYDNGDWA